MKIALAQLNYHIGNFSGNTEKIIGAVRKAGAAGADLVVFPELAVCGYPPLDFLEFRDFIDRCEKAVLAISRECSGIAAIVGAPSANPESGGKDLYNSAFYLADGGIRKVIHKSLLPNYDVFDEYRYFEPARSTACVDVCGNRTAITICEDLWNREDDPLYGFSPMESLAAGQPGMIINIAASPFDHNHADRRRDILKRNAIRYGIPLIYVNHVGGQTEMLFDGGSMVIDAGGKVACELSYFEEDLRYVELETAKGASGSMVIPDQQPAVPGPSSRPERMCRALIMGVRDYFGKLKLEKAVLGLSGGIDSAVTAVLAAHALGKENVLCVLMPSPYSSAHSVNDALHLCANAGIPSTTLPIDGLYADFMESTKPLFGDRPEDTTEQNLQARIRAVLLMALSNKLGHILLNTSNKSEMAVGYSTLYGDLCGGLSVLGDVYKTDVYKLAEYLNHEAEVIPLNIIRKEPSAELAPDQKDTDSLPPYDLLDEILFRYIELRMGPGEITRQGFDISLVDKVLKMVNSNEYKRWQAPPILRVSQKAFGLGRRMPIVGKYLS